jgi:putative transposase
MKYDPHIHQRRSMRLKGYDYASPGAYFVTIVTYQREQILGDVVYGDMKRSALGEIVREEWMRSIGIRKEIRLYEDEFVVMPNHVHAIVWLIAEDEIIRVGADGVCPVVDGVPPKITDASLAPQQSAPQQRAPQQLVRRPKSLGSFIAGYKASVTSRAGRELNMTGIWQRNYYDHIIRNEDEYKRIFDYIDSNPVNWKDDDKNPAR